MKVHEFQKNRTTPTSRNEFGFPCTQTFERCVKLCVKLKYKTILVIAYTEYIQILHIFKTEIRLWYSSYFLNDYHILQDSASFRTKNELVMMQYLPSR